MACAYCTLAQSMHMPSAREQCLRIGLRHCLVCRLRTWGALALRLVRTDTAVHCECAPTCDELEMLRENDELPKAQTHSGAQCLLYCAAAFTDASRSSAIVLLIPADR